MDFLNGGGELKEFDVCIDKGTFDAISLNPDDTKQGKKLYVQALKDALKDKGFFAVTSCNWTKEQLLERFNEGERKPIIACLVVCFRSIRYCFFVILLDRSVASKLGSKELDLKYFFKGRILHS